MSIKTTVEECLDLCSQYLLLQSMFNFVDNNNISKSKKSVTKKFQSVNNKSQNTKRKLQVVKKQNNQILYQQPKQSTLRSYLNNQCYQNNYFSKTSNKPYNSKQNDISFKNSFENTAKFNFNKYQQNQILNQPKQSQNKNYQRNNPDLYYMNPSYNKSYAMLSQFESSQKKFREQLFDYQSPRKHIPLTKNIHKIDKSNSVINLSTQRSITPTKYGERPFYQPKRSPIKKTTTLSSDHKETNIINKISNEIKNQRKNQNQTYRSATQWGKQQTQARNKIPVPINFYHDDDIPDSISRISRVSESKTTYKKFDPRQIIN